MKPLNTIVSTALLKMKEYYLKGNIDFDLLQDLSRTTKASLVLSPSNNSWQKTSHNKVTLERKVQHTANI